MSWYSATWTVGGDPEWETPGHTAVRLDEAQREIDRLTGESTGLRAKVARLEGEAKINQGILSQVAGERTPSKARERYARGDGLL